VARSTITAHRGDTVEIFISLTDVEGLEQIDVTGMMIWFTLKRSPDDTDLQALLQKNTSTGGVIITNTALGQAKVILSAEETSAIPAPSIYLYDVQVKDASGKVTTVDEGYLDLRTDITRTFV
jgi:hypothetical protein